MLYDKVFTRTSKEKLTFNNPETMMEFIRSHYFSVEKEQFILICFETEYFVKSIRLIATGSIKEVLGHPRNILQQALRDNAQTIVIAHNHPSKKLYWSIQDVKVAKVLADICKILEITLLDAIIFNDVKYISLLDRITQIFPWEWDKNYK